MSAPAAPQPSSLAVQLVRYGVVGVLNTAVGLVLILGLHAAGLGVTLANLLGYAACWALAFALNRSWTFEDSRQPTPARLVLWTAVTGGSLAANLALVATLVTTGVPYPAAQLCGCLLYSSLAFFGARHVVFARPS